MDRLLSRLLRGIYEPRIDTNMASLGIESKKLKDYVLDVVTGDIKYGLLLSENGTKIISPNGEKQTAFKPDGARLVIDGVKGYSVSDVEDNREIPKKEYFPGKDGYFPKMEKDYWDVDNGILVFTPSLSLPYAGGMEIIGYQIIPKLKKNYFPEQEKIRHEKLVDSYNEMAARETPRMTINPALKMRDSHYVNAVLGKAIESFKENTINKNKAPLKEHVNQELDGLEKQYTGLKTTSMPKIKGRSEYDKAIDFARSLIEKDTFEKLNFERERIFGKRPLNYVSSGTPSKSVYDASLGEYRNILLEELASTRSHNETKPLADVADFAYGSVITDYMEYSQRIVNLHDFQDNASFKSAELFFHLFEEELDRALLKGLRGMVKEVPEMMSSHRSIFESLVESDYNGFEFSKAHAEESQKHVFETRFALMDALREYEKTGNPEKVKKLIPEVQKALDEGDERLESLGIKTEDAMAEIEKSKSEYRASGNLKKVIGDLEKLFPGNKLAEHHFLSVAYATS